MGVVSLFVFFAFETERAKFRMVDVVPMEVIGSQYFLDIVFSSTNINTSRIETDFEQSFFRDKIA